MNYKDNIADVLVKARKRMQMSQDTLAKKMFVTRQAVSNWENGKAYPDVSLIFKLCKTLKIDIKQIVDLDKNIKIEDLITIEKRKTNRRNLILGGVLVLVFFVVIGTLIIVFNRNAFSVYNVYLDSQEFELDNCIIVKSKVKNYMQFGTLISRLDNTNDDTVYNIRMYKKNQNEERLIFEQDYERNIKIIEDYGYKEYFDDTDMGIDNLYLEISFIVDDKKETYNYKLRVEEVFKNENLIYLKGKKIGEEDVVSSEFLIDEDKLYTLGYTLDSVQDKYIKHNMYGIIEIYPKAKLIILKRNLEESILLIYYYLNQERMALHIFEANTEILKQNISLNNYDGVYIEEVKYLENEFRNIKSK